MQPYVAGPRSHLPLEVIKAARLSPTPRIRHGVDVLYRDLTDAPETLPLDMDAGGSVNWNYRPSDPAAGATRTVGVRRSATISLAGDVDDGMIVARLFRLWSEEQAPTGEWVRWWSGVFTAHLPRRSWDGRVVRRNLTLQPLEHLWATRATDDGETIEFDADVLTLIKADLADVFNTTDTAFPTPAGDRTLGEDLWIPANTPYLTKWTKMLNGIGLDQPTTDEAGMPTSVLLSELADREAEITYAPQGDVVEAGRIKRDGSVKPLDPSLPNVVRFTARRTPGLGLPEEGNGWVTFRNQSTGPGSIDKRGFEVFREISADASTQDELEAFGAAEAQRYFAGGGLRFEGTVAWNPRHSDRDRVELIREALDLDGDWDLTSWKLPRTRVSGEGAVTMPITAEARVVVTQDAAA